MVQKWRIASLDAVIHSLAWIIAYYVITMLFNHSYTKVAYGLLSGWWCSLYVGYLRKIELFALIPLLAIYITFTLLDIIFKLGFFPIHDVPEFIVRTSGFYLTVFVGRFVLLSSPIFVNLIVRKIIQQGETRKGSGLKRR